MSGTLPRVLHVPGCGTLLVFAVTEILAEILGCSQKSSRGQTGPVLGHLVF